MPATMPATLPATVPATMPATMHRLADGTVALVLAEQPPHGRPFLVTLVEERDPHARDHARARLELARGTTTLGSGPVPDALASLTLATALLGDEAPLLALRAAVAAADAAWAAGDRAACAQALTTAEQHAARAAGPAGDLGAMTDYVSGMLALLEERPDDARRSLRRAVAHDPALTDPEPLLRATAAALLLGDIEAGVGFGARSLAAARLRGDDAAVAQALEHLAYAELRAGRHARARTHAVEGLAAAAQTGRENTAAHHRAILALAASVAGDVDEAAEHVARALATARDHGLMQTATLALWAAGRLDLARGRPVEAAARLGELVRPPSGGAPAAGHFAVRHLVMPSFVEAAVASGQQDLARAVAEEYAAWASFGADPLAPALLARCCALLAPGDAGELHFRRALELHATAGGDFELARTQLLFGQWLRRRRRPSRARDHLRDALHGFERCGGAAWAELARSELRAAGQAGTAAPVSGGAEVLSRLTPHQQCIARCVADGDTNREIARRLSVSVRTVDHHLRNIFVTLGVRSRVELARIVAAEQRTASAG